MRRLIYSLLIAGLLCWEAAMGAVALPRSAAHNHPVRRSGPTVALTFDDGPHATYTPQVLHILRMYHVEATFFCIGNQVQKHADIVQQTFQDGNVIGNHTWSHPNLTRLSSKAIRQQLRATSIAIRRATGERPTLFRPPYGATNAKVRRIAAQLGMIQFLWTIDTRDWRRPGVAAIVNTVLSRAKDRSIILMHDGGGDRSQTVQALPQIIRGLRQRGFTFVPLRSSLWRRHTPVEPLAADVAIVSLICYGVSLSCSRYRRKLSTARRRILHCPFSSEVISAKVLWGSAAQR